MTEQTRKQIEEGLNRWSDINSEARKRFDAAQAKQDQALKSFDDAIAASVQLTEADFAIRINVRI